MKFDTRALRFDCEDCSLIGIVTTPERAAMRGVLIVTGGPQYRVGSHRQFVLLSRELALNGIATMRFDSRGMGDSEGEQRSFEAIDGDIRCALSAFLLNVPAVREVVIWGLCDGATAAILYAHTDRRVSGLILLNPWVRTPEGKARATLKHYYLSRLIDRQFWRKLLRGQLAFGASIHSLGRQVRLAARERGSDLPQRVVDSLAVFVGPILIVLSGMDLTAREFDDLLATTELECQRADLAQANHTFARREWRDQVAHLCVDWIASW
jgi:uncharacterized protein